MHDTCSIIHLDVEITIENRLCSFLWFWMPEEGMKDIFPSS